jgi:phosphoglycolate phosphatase
MRTLLFDIDGTLLLSGGGGREAMRRAILLEFGIANPWADLCFSGRTDRFLLAQLIRGNDLADTDDARERLRQRYVSLFPEFVWAAGGRVLPGVRELLSRLSQDDRVRVAVMTGNLPETATSKLEHFGLLEYTQWIVGGDLDSERDALARRAADFIRDNHGEDAAEDVLVIGDTPFDVQCGHAIGARVVAVCTGIHSRDDLIAACPHCGFVPQAVWNDFSDWQNVAECLLSNEPEHIFRLPRCW